MSVIQYVASDAGTFPEDAYFLDPRHIDELTSEWEFESLAQDAALDYFDNHDGWESDWPLDIELFIDGESIGVFAVEMEHVPRFSARKKQETAQ
ncbi:hypothetical protein AAHD50_00895 [Enterobacter hormaechei]|uniref:Uncharacterized protein n=1 Tax=Enterobacter hormaechei TaxID=158836 RepID=A0AAP8GJ95_9ENTR|nr:MULTISPECIES: hypothetical protein [Enterobacter]CAE7601435.1 hypothetical protein AI2760V1_1838 [Enterobacter cloacae]EJV4346413.1 hypothetical protein [Enterobacter hormaechei]ELZ5061516.1 hypothetical protein [Enterobacter hormaechei]KTJ49564.1 hypothetical protein ASU83_21125 [Enterobacter hormaechei subsp. xiangfangensis]KVJ53652.1 hypothetical protein AWS30_16065 [Enterobacter hormaechei subsp. xiangfangensis]